MLKKSNTTQCNNPSTVERNIHKNKKITNGEQSSNLDLFDPLHMSKKKLSAGSGGTENKSQCRDVKINPSYSAIASSQGSIKNAKNPEDRNDSETSDCNPDDPDKENKDPQGRNTASGNDRVVRGRPSSCVFVASLCSSKTDDELCLSVTSEFSKWGKLATVKVLRDLLNRPYAFVQYTNDEDAKIAIEKGHNTVLDGRNLRCEAAKVNRTIFVAFKYLKNEKLVNDAFGKYGEIEQIAASDEFGNYKNNMKLGTRSSRFWFCKYAFRDDAIKAFANLSENPSLLVQWAQNIDRNTNDTSRNSDYSTAKTPADDKQRFDKFSVFVGQLRSTTTEKELVDRFKKHGTILECTLLKKPTSTFGFIKFESESSAASAVEIENHSMFKDKTMHVQYREIQSQTKNSKPANTSNQGIPLAPPPINLNKKNTQNSKTFSPRLQKDSPYHHFPFYPIPFTIPPQKAPKEFPANAHFRSRGSIKSNSQAISMNIPGNPNRKKVPKYDEFYEKFDYKRSPTPPESMQTYDSRTLNRSTCSPSSGLNSERTDLVKSIGCSSGTCIVEGAPNKRSMPENKMKNVPYFYYVPTNELAYPPSPNYFSPYQCLLPYDASQDLHVPNNYGMPFPIYYPASGKPYSQEEPFSPSQ